MRSFQYRPDLRRQVYLELAGSIESQLRDVYAQKHDAGLETQASLAKKLGIDRSAVNRRLTGRTNMTIETIADMAWALGQCINVDIFDPSDRPEINHPLAPATTVNLFPRTDSSSSGGSLVLAVTQGS